ncbi:hypothetical protein KY338_05430 [Candidatus Woesearchaeota archaeon]|nr:hypothetical protein [Candidatus Woesearchaeota archaeon]MBW3006344.1 hypothetical protein [Candidatus Woesearchaeota archaeon]
MSEEQEERKSLGFRGHNIEEFLEQFKKLGYVLQSDERLNVINNDTFWDDNNELNKGNFQVVLDSETNAVHFVPASISTEEYDEIARQLEKGKKAQAELQDIQVKNADLEKKIQQIKDELHGTKTGITGLQSQKDTEEAALEALRKELAVLKEKKQALDQYLADTAPKRDALDKDIEEKEAMHEGLEESINAARQEVESLTQQNAELLAKKEETDKYIQDKDPNVKAIEKEIAELDQKKQEAEQHCKEAEEALERARAASKEERAELDKDFNQREAKLQDLTAKLTTAQKEFEDVSSQLEAKKAAIGAIKADPEAIQKTKTYKELLRKYSKRDLVLRRIIRSVVSLEPKQELDENVVRKFFSHLLAVGSLYAKLDEVAASVLEQEPEQAATPKEKDSTISRFVGWANTKIRRKSEEPETLPETTKYLIILGKIQDAVDAYKQAIAGHKAKTVQANSRLQACEKKLVQAKESQGLDEKAEALLNDLLGAVYAKPTDEEAANPAYVLAFVEGVRGCSFELYSLIASSNPAGMAYVLADLAESKYDAGDIAAAVELTKKGITLCKKQLPDDKEKLAGFEEKLKIYSENSE